MDFIQENENTFILSFKVGDRIKCETHQGEDVDLKIMAYIDGYVVYKLGDLEPSVINIDLFKQKLIDLNAKIG